MFGFKKKKEVNNDFLVPVSGTIVDIDQVPDPIFAQKMMGDGFAIQPTGKEVYAPISGTVISVFPHAVGIKGDNGIEVLVHCGIDTVNLQGEGFNNHVSEGDHLNAGDLMIEVNWDSIKDKVPAIITPVVFTNLNGHTFTKTNGDVEAKNNTAVVINE